MRLPINLGVSSEHLERMVDDASAGIQSVTHMWTRRQSDKCVQSSGNCYTSDSATIPIVLGTVIPLSAALIVLFILHRRNQKRQAMEDERDPHKELDFGLDGVPTLSTKNRRGGPEMTNINTSLQPGVGRHAHGLSMDDGMTSPYLLPAGLRNSKESLRSLNRSISDEHDPYRPVTRAMHSDNDSIRSGRGLRVEKSELGSLHSTSTLGHTQEHSGLIANARPMSHSARPMHSDPLKSHMQIVDTDDDTDDDEPPPHMMGGPPPPRKQSLATGEVGLGIDDRKDLPMPPEPVAKDMPQPPRTSSYGNPPRRESTNFSRRSSVYANSRRSSMHNANRRSSVYDDDSAPDVPSLPMPEMHLPMPTPPDVNLSSYDINPALIFATTEEANAAPPLPSPLPRTDSAGGGILHAPQPISAQRLSVIGTDQNGRLSVYNTATNRISVMGVRPLPPADTTAEDNPEVRANRIRSFYREYFDDNKPMPANSQWEDADGGYDASFFDAYGDMPSGGNRPFAQGPGRRAFTPPPRGPPRVSGQSGMHARKFSTHSVGGRLRPRGGNNAPKPKLPPPKALTSLPTPYLLKEDNAIFNAADFAPPSTFRGLQNGARPDSPAGVSRPYSPAVRAFTPLASSFDNLTVMPSPHELRKSSTFTALDFALPSRFRDGGLSVPGTPRGGASDAGSIRSFRSGISAMQSDAIRQGAYRVSRLPKDMVTTRDDLSMQLRPRMDLVERA